MGKDFKMLRKKILSNSQIRDEELYNLCKKVQSHDFLTRDMHYVYKYLTEYVVRSSEQHFQDVEKRRFLDWGCGTGQITYLLKKHGMMVDSCDVLFSDGAFGSESQIIKQGKISVIPLRHDYLLPFEDSSFDVVLSFGVLEHVPNDRKSLQEVHRILKTGGLFFIFNLPNKYSWTQFFHRHFLNDNYHDRLYTIRQTREMLIQNGFEEVDSWRRQFFPKNKVSLPFHNLFEKFDHFITWYTPLGLLSTNIVFVSKKT